MGKQPVKLIAPDQIFVKMASFVFQTLRLYLTDYLVHIFTYAKQGLKHLTEEVHIYDDIKFSTPNDYSI
jgi:hypothetical protein